MPISRERIAPYMARIMANVEQHDPHTFLVQSRSNASRRYLVSLAANWGHGMCTCADWEARRQPALRKSGVSSERNECWHIKQARRYWAIQTTLATAQDEALAEGVVGRPEELSAPAGETPF